MALERAAPVAEMLGAMAAALKMPKTAMMTAAVTVAARTTTTMMMVTATAGGGAQTSIR